MTAPPPGQQPSPAARDRGARHGSARMSPPDGGRDAFAERSRQYDATRPNRARKINSAVALRLWKRGASDGAIAEACGVGRRAAKAWRDARGLPANRDQGGVSGVWRISGEAKAGLTRRLSGSEPIAGIARELGVTAQALDWHQRRAGLAVGPPAPRLRPLAARRLYDVGESDSAIAAALDVHRTAVRRWRVRVGLPANYSRGNAAAQHARRREAQALPSLG